MTVSKNKVVSLSYQLTVDGDVVDKATDKNPLQFIFGTGMLLPKFEANIDGLKVGDTFAFTLAAADGYGEVNEDNIKEFPMETFEIDGQIEEDLLVEGNTIPMQDGQGHHFNATVLELKDSAVLLDFNHPLAGMDLNFEGAIVDLREATEKELQQGLQHQCCCGEGCDCDDDNGCDCDDDNSCDCDDDCDCHKH
ncbi:MAG: peptidylprolyl isomerase [Prevotellaceae bacterium]|jgi:FKBP-type peptidyl-prolyl cis-trans isomerase SlyD|nr:peptidylprolyl isomerase [Prevotellaceae bacterium]